MIVNFSIANEIVSSTSTDILPKIGDMIIFYKTENVYIEPEEQPPYFDISRQRAANSARARAVLRPPGARQNHPGPPHSPRARRGDALHLRPGH